MASQRAMLSYWNGSAWTNVIMAGTTNSALISATIKDTLGNPSLADFRIANDSSNPYSGSGSNSKGPYTGVFTDFMPIRVIDDESKTVIFYGLVYSVSEKYEKQYGMILELICKDFMMELRDNISDGELGFNIDTSVSLGNYNSNWTESNKDLNGKVWNTGISTRGGLIKSFISKTTSNLTVVGDANRFVDSVKKFPVDSSYKLGERNNKSVLAHIATLSAQDPQSATGEQLFGYDYYTDPNFQSTATSSKPTAMFNYFKRASRPNVAPGTYGLKIEQPSAGGFTASGRLHAMLDFDFERPQAEIFTDAVTKFPYTNVDEDGSTSTETRSLKFEALQIKGESGIESLRCTPFTTSPTGGTIIANHPAVGHGTDDASISTYFPEWMRVKLDGSGNYDETNGTLTTIARIQYVNKTQNQTISDANPAYVIISEVDESINSTAFADGVKWYGKNATSSYITLKSRPRTKYGVKRTAKIEIGSEATQDTIRENIASALIRSSNQIVRGNFQTFEKPRFYIDNSPSSVSGTSTQTITLNNVNPLDYGFREGMVVMKLDSDSEPTTTYGYASTVSSTQVVVTWATGQISASDTVRYYVPVRAGDVISVRNDLVDVNGVYLVTAVNYTEQPGVTSTRYDVVGQEDLTVGGNARKTAAASAVESANQSMNLPMRQAQAAAMANALVTCTFSATTDGSTIDTDGVYWTAGNLSIGIDQYAIAQGTTITTMVTSANGNTGQSGTALASGVDYYIYYPGSGTALATIRRANYKNVVSEDTMLIAQCKAGTTRAEFTLFTSTFKNNPIEGARENSLSTALTKKGIQPWSTNILFEGTSYRSFKWYKKGQSDSTAGNISFGSDGDSDGEAIDAGNSGNLAVNTFYVYKRVGDSANATLVITTDYADVYSDDRILLATVDVQADNGQESPTLLPYNGNVATISAGAISARAITADNIKTGSLTTGVINFNAGDIGGNTDTTASIRAVSAGTSGTIGGIQVAASKLFIGDGDHNDVDTGFYVDSSGNFSLKNKFAWNAANSTLAIDGTVTIGSTAAATLETKANSATQSGDWSSIRGGTVGSDLGGGYGDSSIGGLTLGTDAIYHGTGHFGQSNTPFFIRGADGTDGNSHAGTAGDFSLGDKFIWNESNSALTIDGTVTIGSTTAALVESRANSANQDSTGTILAGNHTGNLNGMDVNNTSGSRLSFSANGIIGYTGTTTKSFELSSNPGSYPLTVWGQQVDAGSSTTGSVGVATRGVEFLNTISGTTYAAVIGPTSTASQLRYDASNHKFSNFFQSGYLEDVYNITLDSRGSGQSTTVIDSAEPIQIRSSDAASNAISIITTGSSSHLYLQSDHGRVDIHARAEETNTALYPVTISHAGAVIAEFTRNPTYADNEPALRMLGDILANSDSAYDIGTNTVKFANGYFDNVTGGDFILNNTDGNANDIDGTRGHWVIQEGEDNLYIKNEITGKKYKFKLEEI